MCSFTTLKCKLILDDTNYTAYSHTHIGESYVLHGTMLEIFISLTPCSRKMFNIIVLCVLYLHCLLFWDYHKYVYIYI